MTENNKTHFRKAFKSPYLSSADIVEKTTLTIKNASLDPDQTKRTKDNFNTIYFVEKEIRQGEILKPMILNAHNSKVMAKITGSAFLEDWQNVPISIYVDSNVKFRGSTVDGLRISPERPILTKPELTPVHKQWDSAIVAYGKDGNFNEIEKRVTISQLHKDMIIEASKGDK